MIIGSRLRDRAGAVSQAAPALISRMRALEDEMATIATKKVWSAQVAGGEGNVENAWLDGSTLLVQSQNLRTGDWEITSVDVVDEGTLVVTSDGVKLVQVPEDQPDAEGKTGWMLFEKPDPDFVYAAPVYARAETPEADEPAEGDVDVPDVDRMKVPELLDYVRSLGVAAPDNATRKQLMTALEELQAEPDEGGDDDPS